MTSVPTKYTTRNSKMPRTTCSNPLKFDFNTKHSGKLKKLSKFLCDVLKEKGYPYSENDKVCSSCRIFIHKGEFSVYLPPPVPVATVNISSLSSGNISSLPSSTTSNFIDTVRKLLNASIFTNIILEIFNFFRIKL